MQIKTYYQGAEKPKHLSQDNLRLLLWPVFVSKVYVANPKGVQVNIFEKAILQLIRSSGESHLDLDEVATWLGIEVEMVTYIIHARCIPNGWVTERYSLTKSGEQFLSDSPPADSITARVYQCAITGEWLPRLGFDVPKVDGDEKKYETRFTLSRGSDYYDKGYLLKPTSQSNIPSKDQLVNIANQYRQSIKTAKATRDDFEFSLQSFESTSILYENSPAELAYLLVWVERSSSYALHAHDPFGVSTRASWMTRLFEQVCRNDSNIAELFLDKQERDENMSFKEVKAFHEEAAKFEMIKNYPQLSLEHPLYDSVLEFQQAYGAVKSSIEDGTRAYRSLVVIAGATLEVVCRHIAKNNPLANVYELPHWKLSKWEKEKYYESRFSESGLNKSQIKKVMAVRLDNIRNAAEGKNSSCRALMAVSFLAAKEFPKHPMHLLRTNSLLFESLYELSHLRDKAAHAETDSEGRTKKFTKPESLTAAKSLSQFLKLVV
ncbi:TPA: hypothetical protein NKZ93_001428 [Vibrio parahaemolyticus]|nr:hypothetical protein [Vibrio parahaemolyticus]